MESLTVNRKLQSDNHETSQNCVYYPRSLSLSINESNSATAKLSFRRCKSEFDIASGRNKIDILMGVKASRRRRSFSADNVSAYEPLSRINFLVNQDLAEDIDNNDDDDDYKLLDSSDDDAIELKTLSINNITANCSDDDDGQQENDNNTSCTIITESTNEHTLQLNVSVATPSSKNNKADNCSVIRKFSTLPRRKSHESTSNDIRRSCKFTINYVNENLNTNEESKTTEEIEVSPVKLENNNNNNRSNDDNVMKIHKSDKINESLFHCTTLPKARSRMSDSLQFRHSLRHSIDSDRARKYLSEYNASGNNTIIVTAASESTSGTSSSTTAHHHPKVKRSRSNLSWLRKSMKKLNPFQIPPQDIESSLSNHSSNNNNNNNIITIPPSTSHDINPSNIIECEKENFGRESQFEDINESAVAAIRLPAVTDENENIQTDGVDTENPDLFNVVLMEQQQSQDAAVSENRPRQYGRRSNPIRISSSIPTESVNHAAARIIAHHQQERPNSAPVNNINNNNSSSSVRNGHRPRQSLPSEQSSLASSRNSSPVSMVSSTGSSSIPDVINTINDIRPRFSSTSSNHHHHHQHNNNNNNNNNSEDDDEREQNESASESKAAWPYLISRPISCLFCTLGLFNISRFAVFSVHFGANFLVQFLILSFIFGIPFLWLQIVLGYKIKGGIVTLFKITPICKGIGISLMVIHCIISLYSSVSIAWVLIYLRDSLISSDEQYLWAKRFDSYRGYQNISALQFSENIADYFNGVVLQRLSGIANSHDGKMRFQLAFNVSIVWIVVFIILCRGIKSLGKIMIVMCLFCFLSLAAVCIKFLTLLNFETVQDIFPATDWQEFFANSNSWSVAAQETFLTWGLLGVSIYSLYCKSGKNQTLNNSILRREALLIVFGTLFGLFLAGIFGSTCIIILKLNGYNYVPVSFENPKNDIFLLPMHYASLPNLHQSIPSKWISRYSNIIGECSERPILVNKQGIYVHKESGWKPLRLITEILPATLAVSTRIEPFWGTIAFVCLFFFGVCQLSVMWKAIQGAIGNSTSAILLSCVTGLFLGVPLTTDNGIVIVHFLDYVFGGAWFIPILWTAYLLAIFMVRGRPYSSDFLVKELRLTETLSAFLAFSWNVLIPVGLLLLSVMEYKKSHSTELFHQRNILSLNHLSNWPLWVKQVGGLLQVSLLILLPCVALVQIYIYLSRGPRDILERIERLFRPPIVDDDSSYSHMPIRRLCQNQSQQQQQHPIVISLSENNNNNNNVSAVNDAPPKYSPPPSYGKAMGLRVAKVLRNSIRRSMRRLRRSENNSQIANEAINIPTISSNVEVRPQSNLSSANSRFGQNINEFIRSSFRRTRNSQSNEQLVLNDITNDYHVV